MQQRNAQYDTLFEPVQIGPKTAKNRFYQVPHCNGMGHRFPRALAEMRGVKAEGGWGGRVQHYLRLHPLQDRVDQYLERAYGEILRHALIDISGAIPEAASVADHRGRIDVVHVG